ncbi:NAD-specific glutamate dehydrogenase [Hydrogenophaga taeniospiralis CCUG 15921]|uniref:NAD-specific glutamate dehydrogenase n=1 Tax=Hydrogenophaga taeniospiralis CCUG 15921 TaxID=1281780 RepID=A0A9X4NUN0_9BURK|nr:NAD-specific glutamate dehydrogenase [Hydrogenophaga taeniospiralis CCUG 15921]
MEPSGGRSALLDFLHLGVNDVVIGVGLVGTRLARAFAGARRGGFGLRSGVHLLAQLLAGRHERFGLGLDVGLVLALGGFFHVLQRGFDGFFFRRIELVAVFAQRLLHAVHHGFGLVAGLHEFDLLLVVGCVELGVFHHLLDLGLGQARVRLDGDLVFLAGALVLGAHVQDAVGVDVEGHFDLRHAARRSGDAFEVELAQQLVARGDLALALEHLDGHGRLVVFGGGEHLTELGRDGGVLADHLGHDAAHGLDAQAQRGHVEQQHVLAVTREHLALDGGAHGHGFVGVHVLARLLAEELFHLLLHLGHAGHAADQDHVVDVVHADAGVLDGGAARRDGALDQLFHQGFELGARELEVQVFRARRVGGDVGQVQIGRGRAGELDLGLLGGFLQALQGQHVLGQVNALLFLELANDVVDDALVEVFAAQEGVAVGGQHLELLLAIDVGDLDDGHVKRAATQVVHGDLAVALFLLVQAEGQGRGGGLVDDAFHVQAGDAASVFRGLALGVVEVGRHGDHGLGHGLAQVVLGGLLHLAQDVGADLLGRDLLAAHFHPGVAVVGGHDGVGHEVDVLLDLFLGELAADQALDRVERVLGVGHGLALGACSDQHLTVFLVSHDRRRGACTFRVLDHLGGVAFHDGHARVGGAQVDADDSSHVVAPVRKLKC